MTFVWYNPDVKGQGSLLQKGEKNHEALEKLSIRWADGP